MVPMLLFWATILFTFTTLMGWLRSPRWILRLSAGIFCGLLSLVSTASAGWYIAVAAFPVYSAGVLGLLFGCFVLTRLAPHGGTTWPAWARATGAMAAILVLGLSIIYPILPERDSQALEVVFVRVAPETEQIATDTGALSADEIKLIRSLGLKGPLRTEVQVSNVTGRGSRRARAVIVLRERLEGRVVLREPKANNILYVQDGRNWSMHPAGAHTLDKKITFWPSRQDPSRIEVEIDPARGSSIAITRDNH
jgi:hypothetical protein